MTERERAANGDGGRSLLIVEDDDNLSRVIHRAFRDSFEVHEARDGIEGIDIARHIEPSVVVSDQRMPKMTGVELLTRIREEFPNTIRILVTGYDDYGPVVDAVNAANVHHYFEKPFHIGDLRMVVETLVRNAELKTQRDKLLQELRDSVEELEKTNAELKNKEIQLTEMVDTRTTELRQRNDELQSANLKLMELAIRDGLTGLYNHRYLIEHMELEVARSNRYSRTFAVLFVDIDGFKQINDRFGHQSGDAILCGVANLLRQGPEGLRRSDLCARYGGEEFCVVLPETPLQGALVKAERIRQAVKNRDWSEQGMPEDFQVTVSIGIAAFPKHAENSDDLLKLADNALYAAKERGRDQVVIYDESARPDGLG